MWLYHQFRLILRHIPTHVNNSITQVIGKYHLLYGLVGSEIVFKGLGPLTVSQHDVVGDRCPRSAFGLNVGPVFSGQVKPHHEVTLGNVHAFLNDACGNQKIGLVGSEFAQDL